MGVSGLVITGRFGRLTAVSVSGEMGESVMLGIYLTVSSVA
jgi:hypothetical protein